jgi:sulfide:quinone oxidoreductase
MHAGTQHKRHHVLVAGGGVAGLAVLAALRRRARSRVRVTLLTPRAHQPQDGAELVLDSLIAVDTQARCAYTRGGRRMPYDTLVVTVGGRRVAPFPGALTFGTGVDAGSLRALVADLIAGIAGSVVFTLPSPSACPLPLYELALLAAGELRDHGCGAPVRLVTPERSPLAIFGPAAAEAITPHLKPHDVELLTDAPPRAVVAGGVRLHDGDVVPADRVVTLADIASRPVPGLPLDSAGFVPTDAHGQVVGEPAVYAAGEATAFPLRQAGLATQQADAVAEAIAAACGAAAAAPAPFVPVVRGRLLTSDAPPLDLQARPREAIALAVWLAEAEARCGNSERARQAHAAAAALDPVGHPLLAP